MHKQSSHVSFELSKLWQVKRENIFKESLMYFDLLVTEIDVHFSKPQNNDKDLIVACEYGYTLS